MMCIFRSNWVYKYNLKQVEHFAKLVRYIPILGYLAKANANQTKWFGIWFIKVWGIFALIIGTLNLYALITQ